MLTLDNHLIGVTETEPHPLSYRPDLPLVGELNAGEVLDMKSFDAGSEEGWREGHDEGFDDGYSEALAEAKIVAEQKAKEVKAIADAIALPTKP